MPWRAVQWRAVRCWLVVAKRCHAYCVLHGDTYLSQKTFVQQSCFEASIEPALTAEWCRMRACMHGVCILLKHFA